AFEQMQREKANTPTPTEEQVPIMNRIVYRMATKPQEREIVGGVTPNKPIPFVNTPAAKGIMGPTIPPSPYHAKALNVTHGGEGPKVGLFKPGEQPDWPIPLQGPEQAKIEPMIGKAVSEVMVGKP